MFWSPSFDGMADLTPYFNHVIASYHGIQNVPHVQVKWGGLLRQAQLGGVACIPLIELLDYCTILCKLGFCYAIRIDSVISSPS